MSYPNIDHNLSIHLRQRQEQKLTPQQIQSMAILQMNTQDLLEHIQQEGEENPVIELDHPKDLLREYQELRKVQQWMNAGVSAAQADFEDSLSNVGRQDEATTGLTAFLKDQIDRLHISSKLKQACHYVAMLLDDDGFLTQDSGELLEEHYGSEFMDEVYKVFQTLEPIGVGASDARESLAWQAERIYPGNQLLKELIEKYLDAVGDHRYSLISKRTGQSIEAVKEAVKLIVKLNPYPGHEFQKEVQVQYVRPDVFIVERDGDLCVIQNQYYIPRISLSSYYQQLLKETKDPEVKNYLRERIKRARWLMSSVERRGNTLSRCTEMILAYQRPFFEGKSAELLPLRRIDIANELELNPSTVSRAMKDKYLQCRQGLYPMGYFCTNEVGEDSSEQAMKILIGTLIRDEDKSKPLSDPQIQKKIEEMGRSIARRTVSKYRMAMGIPSANRRKKYGSE